MLSYRKESEPIDLATNFIRLKTITKTDFFFFHFHHLLLFYSVHVKSFLHGMWLAIFTYPIKNRFDRVEHIIGSRQEQRQK